MYILIDFWQRDLSKYICIHPQVIWVTQDVLIQCVNNSTYVFREMVYSYKYSFIYVNYKLFYLIIFSYQLHVHKNENKIRKYTYKILTRQMLCS